MMDAAGTGWRCPPGVSFSRSGDGTAVPPSVVAVRVSGGGKVVEAPDGFGFSSVSEVAEPNDTLWVGSVDTPYAGKVQRHMRA
jgi:hypothetical protein